MLKLHQDETCDGIICHLEKREGKARHDVRVPEVDNQTSPAARVEMTFRLGDQLYAIEHTGIGPFEGFMEHQNRESFFKPLVTSITAALRFLLAPGVVIEMHMPADAFIARKSPEVRSLHKAITAWAAATAPMLPMEHDGRRTQFLRSRRSDKSGGLPGCFQIIHLTIDSEQPRELAIKRECEENFPKLYAPVPCSSSKQRRSIDGGRPRRRGLSAHR